MTRPATGGGRSVGHGTNLPRWSETIPRRVLATALGAVFVLMMCAIWLGMVSRYLLAAGFEWSSELAGIAFIWLTFIGAIEAELTSQNVGFNMVEERLPETARRWLALVRTCLLLIVGAALMLGGIWALPQASGVTYPLLGVPQVLAVAGAPLMGGCVAIIAVTRLPAALRKVRRNPASHPINGIGTDLK